MQNRYPLSWKIVGTGALAMLVVLALLSVAGGPAAAQVSVGGAPVNSISVVGMGEASGTPDVAFVEVGVDVQNANISEAVNQANADVDAVIKAIREAGVAEEDTRTVNFNVFPEDRYDPQSGQPTGERVYRVQNTVRATVRDIAEVGTVVQAALNAGADTVWGLNFGIDDTSALEQEARLKAIEDARARAQQLADAFGVTVGEPIIISEGFGGVGPVIPFDRVQAGGVGGAPSIVPGQLSVSVQVNVTFALGA